MIGALHSQIGVAASRAIGIVLIALGAILCAAGMAHAAQDVSMSQPPSFSAAAINRINSYRRLINLPEVSEDETMSASALSQAQSQLGGAQAAGLANAAPDSGAAAAPAVRVISNGAFAPEGGGNPPLAIATSGTKAPADGGYFIDRMMAMPFTALRIIDPQLARVGFGAQCAPGGCVAVMLVRRGLDKSVRLDLYEGSESDRFWNPRLGPFPPTRGRLKAPVEFPPDGGTTPLLAYPGGDSPNPLGSCPGYSAPSGPPIILQLGSGISKDTAPVISSHTLTRDGAPVAHCLIPATSTGGELSAFGAAIVIPREPLKPSSTYAVSITADSKNYSWSFRAGAAQ